MLIFSSAPIFEHLRLCSAVDVRSCFAPMQNNRKNHSTTYEWFSLYIHSTASGNVSDSGPNSSGKFQNLFRSKFFLGESKNVTNKLVWQSNNHS